MTTLITGGCGFVGINLAEALLAAGEPVVLFDRRALPAAAATALQSTGAGPVVVEGEARHGDTLRALIERHSVDRVVHAAVITSGAAREASEPGEVIDINIGGTVRVLEAARAAGCARVVCVSSGSAYGRTLDLPGPVLEEVSPSRPDSLYGITKFAAEATALRLRALWDFDIVCVRLGSVFGPWEYGTGARDRLSPMLQIARLAAAGEAAVLPAAEVQRDWVYSRDVARGLQAVLRAPALGHAVYHLSSGIDWRGILPRWCDTLAATFPAFRWRLAAAGETPNVACHADSDRAKMSIERIGRDAGYRPAYGAAEACGDMVGWLRAYPGFVEPATGR